MIFNDLSQTVFILLCAVGFGLSNAERAQCQQSTKALSKENEAILSGVRLSGIGWQLRYADDRHANDRHADDRQALLRKMLKHPSKEVRCPAMEFLHECTPRKPLIKPRNDADKKMLLDYYAEIVAQLSEDDDDSKALAAGLIGKIGPKAKDAVPKLEMLLSAKDGIVRCHVLAALIRIQGKLTDATREKVCECAANEVDSFCIEIIKALGSAKTDAPEVLWGMYQQSKSDSVRAEAIGVIGDCGREAVGFSDRLVAILLNQKMGDRVRGEAAMALGQVDGCGEAEVKILIRTMLNDASDDMRHSASYSLVQFPGYAKIIRPALEHYSLQSKDADHLAHVRGLLRKLDDGEKKLQSAPKK